MTISFLCVCGINYNAEDAHAGQYFTCPTCQQTVIIPAAPAAPPPLQSWAPAPQSQPQAPSKPSLLSELEENSVASMDALLLGGAPQSPKPQPPPYTPPPPPAQTQPGAGFAPPAAPAPDSMAASFEEMANLFAQAESKPGPRRSTTSSNVAAPAPTGTRRRATSARAPSQEEARAEPPAQKGSARRRTTHSAAKASTSKKAPQAPELPVFVTCTLCDEEFSREARECPNCGAAAPRDPGFAERNAGAIQKAKLIGMLLGLVALVGIALSMINDDGSSTGPRRGGVNRRPDDKPDSGTEKNPGDGPKPGDKPNPDTNPDDKPKPDDTPKPENSNPDGSPKPEDPIKKDPLEPFKAQIEALTSVKGDEIKAEIDKLAAFPARESMTKLVLRHSSDQRLIGRCLLAMIQGSKANDRKSWLLEALKSTSPEAAFFAAEEIAFGPDEALRASALNENSIRVQAALRLGALWGRLLLELGEPDAKDLSRIDYPPEMPLAVDWRWGLLQVWTGNGRGLENCVRAFEIENPRIATLTQAALTRYSNRQDILLDDPSSGESRQLAKKAWSEWIESYQPVQRLLADLLRDPALAARSGFNEEAKKGDIERQVRLARVRASVELLKLESNLVLPALRNFLRVEPEAQAENALRVAGRLVEAIAKDRDNAFLLDWLLNWERKEGAREMVAACLNAVGEDAVTPAFSLVEKGFVSLEDLANTIPDFKRTVKSPALDALEGRLAELKGGNLRFAWCILASCRSKRTEVELETGKRLSGFAKDILSRQDRHPFEKDLIVEMAGEKDKYPHIDPGAAAGLLEMAGHSDSFAKVFQLIRRKDAIADRAAVVGRYLAQPGDVGSLLREIDNESFRIAVECARAVGEMYDDTKASALGRAYNNKKVDIGVRTTLKEFLLLMRYRKSDPLEELREQVAKWEERTATWETKRSSSSQPRLDGGVAEGLGRVGQAKDAATLVKAFGAANSAIDRDILVTALGHLEAPEGQSILLGFLNSNERSRGRAALALSQCKNAEEHLGALEGLIRSRAKIDEADGQVLEAISLIDPAKAGKLATLALTKEVDELAAPGIAFAIARDPDGEGKDAVAPLLCDPRPVFREGLCYGLALAITYKPKDVCSGLEELLTPILMDEDRRVPVTALIALLSLNSKAAPTLVYSVIRDGGPSLERKRSDLWNEYIDPPRKQETFEAWASRLARISIYLRPESGMSRGCAREALVELRARAKR